MLKADTSEVWPESVGNFFVDGLRQYWESPWATYGDKGRPTLGASSGSPDNSFPPLPVGPTSSRFDNIHDLLSPPTPILRNSKNSLDVPTFPAPHTSYPSLRSLTSLTPPAHSSSYHHHSSPSRWRSGHSDVQSTHPSPANNHVDAGSDTSLLSLVAGFIKKTVQRICRPSPSPDAETDIGSTTQADLDVEPFAFKPLQLASLVDPKSLKNLESLGGVEGLIRGLGTDRVRGLSPRLTQLWSHDPRIINAVTSDVVGMTSLTPNISSPASVTEGPQRSATLRSGSSAGDPASFKFSPCAYEATIQDRQRIYGHYILPQRPTKSLLLFMWLALQDKVIVLLSIAAVVSFTLGLFQDFGTSRPQGDHPMNWVQGVTIIAAILVVVAVGSLNDWQTERHFQALNEKKEGHFVKVIRNGGERQIDIHQVVVGDVVLLEPGEVAPCDGVFLSGHNIWYDESSATGESNAIKKLSYEECIILRDERRMEFDPDGPSGSSGSVGASQRKTDRSGLESLEHADCFIVGGSKVLEGVGSYVVISVGTKSFDGHIVAALRRDSEDTPLQLKLNDLAEVMTNIGSIAGGLLFAALLVRYFVQLGTNNPQRTSIEKGIAFVNILIISVTLVVVAVPEGLPLTVTHALAFATKRMSKESLLVRVLGSCETMTNASVVCTDKTGTPTQDEMTAVAVSVGIHTNFVRRIEENRACTGSEARSDLNAKDIGVDLANLVNDSVRKFLQFQTPTHFTTVVVMTVWVLASSSDKPILGVVQLLWINIIMGTFATLALMTDPASPVLLDRKTDPLFTVDMIKQILGQVAYQIIITVVLHFLGSRILGFRHTDDLTLQKHHDGIMQTLVFNVFVFAQVSNSFNCRRLDKELNVFEGVSKNRYFVAITIIEIAVQVLICFAGGAAFGVTRMGVREWCISVALGCVSLPLGALIRLTPNEPCERLFKKLRLLPEPELLPTTCLDAEPGFSFALDQVGNNSGTLAKLRASRMHGLSFVRESRIAFPEPDALYPLPRLPRTSGSLSGPTGFGRSGPSAALCGNGFEVHPDTSRSDPVYGLLGVIQQPATTR
ncbi:hypothetical protein EDB87DRAFT_1834866 [Lactarius vividus]|nr:hypothetical protein EDB87DRAFT_1834866 [Lactarius vividus]